MQDKLYEKYRVFKEPDGEGIGGHPVQMHALWYDGTSQTPHSAEEVTGFAFVLHPSSDHHARVALAAYAASCTETHPQLSEDLFGVLSIR